MKTSLLAIAAGLLLASTPAFGHTASGKVCEHTGPQTPRDIDNKAGENPISYRIAPPSSAMNLCNIHFHESAEHKGGDFTIYAGDGHEGYGSGYQCQQSKKLSEAELKPTKEKICPSEHGDLVPGDTIEVHWVYTTCDVEPGKGLGSCSSKACANPELRVESAVFTLVNDPNALNFQDFIYGGNMQGGHHQPKALPDLGTPVEFIGSTTGPKYDESHCSPYQVTWNVRPKCGKLNIHSIGEWCKGNVFQEDHAHGVRKLVTNPKLLSPIQ